MLSKFAKLIVSEENPLESTDLEPLKSIKEARDILDSDIAMYRGQNGKLSKEDAQDILYAVLHNLSSIYKNTQSILKTGTIKHKNLVTYYLLGGDSSLDGWRSADAMAKNMALDYDWIKSLIQKDEPFESMYIGLTRILVDSKRTLHKLKHIHKQSEFFEVEVEILDKLVIKVLLPLLAPVFKHFKDHYVFIEGRAAFKIAIDDLDEELCDRFVKLCGKLAVANLPMDIENQLQDEIDQLEQKLYFTQNICAILMHHMANNENADHVDKIMPLLRQLYTFPEKKKAIVKEIEEMAQKINVEIRKARQKKSLPTKAQPAIPTVVYSDESDTSSESEDEIEPPQVLAAHNVNNNCPPKASTGQAKSVLNQYERQATLKPKHVKIVNNKNESNIKGNPGKTIAKIFSGTKKIKYHNLVVLIDALKGITNESTGSSARKMYLQDQKLFLHKRHGRYRAIYVDPNVIKDMCEMLKAIGITADNPAFPASMRQRP